MQRVVAIVNPVSGRYGRVEALREVGRLLGGHDRELEVLTTDGVGHATILAQEQAAGADAVLVVGGDGTVNEVVNGLVGTTTPIVVWGAGTENLLARELSLPRGPRGVVGALLSGELIHFDVGVLNDRRFLCVAGIGFDAECVARLKTVRRGHISHFDHIVPVWRTFRTHRFPDLRVTVDDVCVFDGRGFALIGMIPRYSAGLRIWPRAQYDDGLLDVCVMPCASRMALAGHAWRALWRRHTGRGQVVYCQGRRVSISSTQDVPIELDGELVGSLPAECSVLVRAVTFLRERTK